MKIVTLFLLLFVGKETYSQKGSFTYNEKGQLCHDTTFTISKEQYRIWSIVENNLATTLADVKFPTIYAENNVQSKGILIVSFICDSNNIKNIKIEKDLTGYEAFSKSVVQSLLKNGNSISGMLMAGCKLIYPNTQNYKGRYFVVYDFDLKIFNEETKRRNAIPIINVSTPLIDLGIH